jgi:hypothetical protein
MVSWRITVPATAIILGSVASAGPAQSLPVNAASSIGFETPSIVDPIHTNGEPDIGIDPQGRVFVSGPTGTGTQRSIWLGSVDKGHSFRIVTPCPLTPIPPPTVSGPLGGCPAPSPIAGTNAHPGGGDTDINFDRSGKQYFADLYALLCLRTATTADGGRTVYQSFFPPLPAGCEAKPGADRQWLAVFDPPSAPSSQYQGPFPLIYMEYNNLTDGGHWVKSNSNTLPQQPGDPGLNFENATVGDTSVCLIDPLNQTRYAPFGADGYPAIDQVTGNVFQAAGIQDPTSKKWALKLNIGTPNAAGYLKFLDYPLSDPCGDKGNLITVAQGLPESPDTLFSVVSMDNDRNLFAVWAVGASGKNTPPADRQVFVSAASWQTGWTKWAPALQVSAAPSMVNVFPWIKAGGHGFADAVWYGADSSVDPSSHSKQIWDVFMSQVRYTPDATGATGGVVGLNAPMVKVTPHPMHYDDVCLLGTGCITAQGNRNLADFFVVTADEYGAAQIVYDDTSNGLIQKPLPPDIPQLADHAGAGVITIARQTSGPGLLGVDVPSGPTNAPVSGLPDPPGDALFPVINGTNVPGMDILATRMNLSADGTTLNVITQVLDLSDPSVTERQVTGALSLQYITRWQMGNTIYYAGMEENAPNNDPMFYAGKAQSIDLCSVSACFPHVLIYPESPYPPAPTESGLPESGSVNCPSSPSVQNPCTLTISVKVADVGMTATTARTSLLESVGAYALAASHQQGTTTNGQAEADNVPLEIDGACCYNFKASVANGGPPPCHAGDGDGDVSNGRGGKAHIHVDADVCEDGIPDTVQESDSSTGDAFQSKQLVAVTFNDALAKVTVLGTGTHNGKPVTFTMVAVNGVAGIGTFNLVLSDGYSVSGTLLSGSIQLR